MGDARACSSTCVGGPGPLWRLQRRARGKVAGDPAPPRVASRSDSLSGRMRICIVYDCLFPWTYGGAERWYRNLAERLASEGHEVTYLTRLQWEPDDPPRLPGVRVIAVSG